MESHNVTEWPPPTYFLAGSELGGALKDGCKEDCLVVVKSQ